MNPIDTTENNMIAFRENIQGFFGPDKSLI